MCYTIGLLTIRSTGTRYHHHTRLDTPTRYS